ncbi:cupin domain-containing protein [Larkinella sp. VNQ87]|uniref:cupin domain-containing protein n=1 Tax=Larkinella sp. VNQ87 TaxID=3400921 RepID=UPI003C0C82F9
MNNWLLKDSQKDAQSITADWNQHQQRLIDGVQVREVKNIIKNNGYLTEIYRREWLGPDDEVDQIFQVVLQPGGISAWHSHEVTTDRLFVQTGTIKIVLYDGRQESATYGLVNEFRGSLLRPQLIVVPPKVWHGVQNIGPETAVLLNIVDKAYQYEDPDHWRIASNTAEIPYRF